MEHAKDFLLLCPNLTRAFFDVSSILINQCHVKLPAIKINQHTHMNIETFKVGIMNNNNSELFMKLFIIGQAKIITLLYCTYPFVKLKRGFTIENLLD